ncbi:hypothetical protein [Candidatus Hodarchaeum mangrovi]
MSGIYGYKIPDNEGIGLFTVQKNRFRIFFLCEGLYGSGVPSIKGKLSNNLEKLFKSLERHFTKDFCYLLHRFEERDTFWFELIYSCGFGENIPLDELEYIFPIQFLQIKTKISGKEIDIDTVETVELGSLGFGWRGVHEFLAKHIQEIFSKAQFSFLLYQTLFIQLSEFVQDFTPNTIILTYQAGHLQENIVLVAFLTLNENNISIRYCLPISSDLEVIGSRSIHSYLRSLFLEPQPT